MSETPAKDSRVLERLLSACRQRLAGEVSPELREASRAFDDAVHADPTLVSCATAALTDMPPLGAAWLGILLGALVEDGFDPAVTGPAMVSTYRRFLDSLSMYDDHAGTPSDTPPEAAAIIDALPELSQSLVAHLARMPEQREILREDEAFLDQLQTLDDYSHGCAWVREALMKVSGKLVLLHVESARGYRLEYRNIANCFHLFSLMQHRIRNRLPGGRKVDDHIVATEDAADVAFDNNAWWHYGDPRSPRAELMASIWGEASPLSIPAYDGEQVILAWPPIMKSRSWDSGFFGCHLEAMPAEVVLGEAIPESECRAWLARLDIAAPRKW